MTRFRPIILLFLLPLILPVAVARAQRLQGLTSTSGTLTNSGDAVTTDVGTATSAGLQITGTWAGTIVFEGTVDNSTWNSVSAVSTAGLGVTQTTANGQWAINLSGLSRFRTRLSVATSGTATINLIGTVGGVPAPIPGVTVSTATLTTTNSAVTMTVGANTAAQLNLAGTNWNGTIVFEGTTDGTNYVSWPLAGVTGSIATQTTTSGAASWAGNTAGFQSVRARVSAVTAGGFSVVAVLVGSAGAPALTVPGLTLSAAMTTSSAVVTVKSTPGQVYALNAYNPHSAVCYLQVYNATAPTPGTTTPILQVGVVNGTGQSVTFPHGVDFTTAITISNNTTPSGATGCGAAGGAAGLVVTVAYK